MRKTGIRVHLAQLGWTQPRLDGKYVHADAFLCEHETNAMGIVVGGIGVAAQPIGCSHRSLITLYLEAEKTRAPRGSAQGTAGAACRLEIGRASCRVTASQYV